MILEYLGGSNVITWNLKVGKRVGEEPGQSDSMGGGPDPLWLPVKMKEDSHKRRNEGSHYSWKRQGHGFSLRASRKERSPADTLILAQ